MTVLVVGMLTGGSAALLSSSRRLHVTSMPLRAVVFVALAAVIGTLCALTIQGLYRWLTPDVKPFSFMFNVGSDTVWVAVNALVVGLVLSWSRGDPRTAL